MSSGDRFDGAESSRRHKQQEQQTNNMSVPPSPAETRHPLSRYESIAPDVEDDDTAASILSTDTVRRRPEGQTATGYGM